MLPCTGRIEEAILLKAFENGADGVMVVGCLEGDCHYLSGNLRARARVARVAAILDSIGFDGNRVRMANLSAGEGAKFAAFASEFVELISQLGPSPINRKLFSSTPSAHDQAAQHSKGIAEQPACEHLGH